MITVLVSFRASLYYKNTVGNEFHQYSIFFEPKLGEDVALGVGFNKLHFSSNTREFKGSSVDDGSGPVAEEIIAKKPGNGIYGSALGPAGEYSTEEVFTRALAIAVTSLADRLKIPVALNGSPALEPIFRSTAEDGDAFVEVYGIRAIYNVLEATQITSGP